MAIAQEVIDILYTENQTGSCFSLIGGSIILKAYHISYFMAAITDELMREMISRSKDYTIVILKAGPKRNMPGAEKIIWEHGREISRSGRTECSVLPPYF